MKILSIIGKIIYFKVILDCFCFKYWDSYLEGIINQARLKRLERKKLTKEKYGLVGLGNSGYPWV